MKIHRAVWIALALAVFGCGKEEKPASVNREREKAERTAMPPPGAAAPAGGGAIATAELDKITKGSKPYKLALIVKTRNNPFFDPMIKAFEAEAKALGAAFETQAPPQESDKERQFALVQDVAAKGVDAILIAPADSKAIVPALKQAQDKGILVINLDNRVDRAAADAAGLTLGGYIGADNEAGGKLAGEAMVAALGHKDEIAVLEGIRGADNAEARKRGFLSAVKDKMILVGSESAEWDTQKAYAKMQNLIAAHPGIIGVFCANDKMALGALKAIQEAGQKGKITVVGYDNIADVQPYLRSGEMAATIEQHPDLMGRYGARMAVGVLDKAVPKGREYLVTLEVIKRKITDGIR